MEATFAGWFLEPYKVSKIGYGLFSYALLPAKRTNASFMGAALEEYLVWVSTKIAVSHDCSLCSAQTCSALVLVKVQCTAMKWTSTATSAPLVGACTAPCEQRPFIRRSE